jgi:hypothetical protein
MISEIVLENHPKSGIDQSTEKDVREEARKSSIFRKEMYVSLTLNNIWKDEI